MIIIINQHWRRQWQQVITWRNVHQSCWCHIVSLGASKLTLVVLKPEFCRQTRSIPWLLMSWLLMSPGGCFITLGELPKQVLVVSHFQGRKFNLLSCGIVCAKNKVMAPHQWCGAVILFLTQILVQFCNDLQPHETSLEELAKWSETPPWSSATIILTWKGKSMA